MDDIRVHRVPFSTNVERIALAAGHKGLTVTWVDHTPGDRAAVRSLSGQDLVPVAELPGGEVVVDSTEILARIDALVPDPPLWPRDPALRARTDVFVDWFNLVWKVAPNAIDAELGRPRPDARAIAGHRLQMRASLARFEALLCGHAHLLGDKFGIADVIAFPFLRYAVAREDGDDERFHRVLAEHLALDGDFPRLEEWVARVDARPRA